MENVENFPAVLDGGSGVLALVHHHRPRPHHTHCVCSVYTHQLQSHWNFNTFHKCHNSQSFQIIIAKTVSMRIYERALYMYSMLDVVCLFCMCRDWVCEWIMWHRAGHNGLMEMKTCPVSRWIWNWLSDATNLQSQMKYNAWRKEIEAKPNHQDGNHSVVL